MPREEHDRTERDVADGEFDARPIEEERDRMEKENRLRLPDFQSIRQSLPIPPGLKRRSSARTLPHPEDADDTVSHSPPHPKDKRHKKQEIEMANMGDKVQEKAGQLDSTTTEQHGDGGDAAQKEWEQHMAALRAGSQNGEATVSNGQEAGGAGRNSNDDESYNENEGVVETGGRNKTEFAQDAFSHPASKEPQRTVWLPEDDLGLAMAEAADNRAIGISSTTTDAYLNRKVSRNSRKNFAHPTLRLTLIYFGACFRARLKSQDRRPMTSKVQRSDMIALSKAFDSRVSVCLLLQALFCLTTLTFPLFHIL
jgi:hypothetical protein